MNPGAAAVTKCVLEDVFLEREHQDFKWGVQDHRPADYLAILAEEFGEASKEVVEPTFAPTKEKRLQRRLYLRTELIQTAAVAVAMIECLDRAAEKEKADGTLAPQPE